MKTTLLLLLSAPWLAASTIPITGTADTWHDIRIFGPGLTIFADVPSVDEFGMLSCNSPCELSGEISAIPSLGYMTVYGTTYPYLTGALTFRGVSTLPREGDPFFSVETPITVSGRFVGSSTFDGLPLAVVEVSARGTLQMSGVRFSDDTFHFGSAFLQFEGTGDIDAVNAVPEPASAVLVLAGLALCAVQRTLRRR